MIQLFFLFSISTLFYAEAFHDFYVIKYNEAGNKQYSKEWHMASAIMHLWWVIAAFCIFALGVEYVRIICFYPVLRGLIFWPVLNKLLGRHPFHLSKHFVEKWFRDGKILFSVYLILFVLGLIFLIKY